MLKSVLLLGIVLIILPGLIGMLYTRFLEQEKNNILLSLAAGYMISWGVFELIALPMIWMKLSLDLLCIIYGGVLAVFAVISVILNFKRFADIIKETISAVKSFTFCIWAELLLIAGQVLFYLRYSYANADDAFFVASANTSIATNTIFAFDPYTGAAYTSLPARYVLSPFHAFNAVVSKVTDTHPAILAHSVFMILLLLLAYAVYALIAQTLFHHNMERTGYFLILVSALNIFSAYSERTGGLFLLIRLWQGKAILAGILLPMVLYMAVRIFLQEGKKADWILFFFLMCACCMVSSMGVMLGAIMAGIFGLLFAFRGRSFRTLVYTFLCCIPNVVCALVYLIIK